MELTSNVVRPIIRFQDVYKSFGPLVVLKGLNLDIPEDQTSVVIGPSGTGKSVLLKHIVGLLKPDAGSVWFHDQQVDKLTEEQFEPIRKQIGFLFQQGALFDSMNVGDNVAYPLRLHKLKSESEIRETVHEKLSVVGMDGSEKKMPGDLSGGQRKRVALARAISMNPEVILYDEPTTGLDPIRADVINELILKLQEEMKVTGIVVTHDMASAFKVADQIVMLYNGQIIFRGNAEQIRQCPEEHVQRFIQGKADEEDLKALRRL
ncbi:MAG TPA: ABC transporter ATP-binding protein [Phycisphaerae bacterium]|nr:ABC transporter ATP-binding protein [Phycisphaerae bacterium]